VSDSSEFKRIQKGNIVHHLLYLSNLTHFLGSLMVSSSAMLLPASPTQMSPVLFQGANPGQSSPNSANSNASLVPKRTIRYGSILKIILPYCKARDDGTALMGMSLCLGIILMSCFSDYSAFCFVLFFKY
jgi:hypothetical protein